MLAKTYRLHQGTTICQYSLKFKIQILFKFKFFSNLNKIIIFTRKEEAEISNINTYKNAH